MFNNSKRVKSIDFLRGVAVILVIFAHYEIVPILKKIGWIGVDLFFVLSGFLVSGLLFREYKKYGNLRTGYFLIRRGFKIYPLFYTFIIFLILVKLLTGDVLLQSEILGEIFFLQNYLGKLIGHTWSLAVEEHFYFFIAILFSFLNRYHSKKPFRYLPIYFFLIGFSCLTLRYFTFINYNFIDQTHHYPSHLRIDSLFFGVLLSYYYNNDYDRLKYLCNKNKYLFWAIIAITLSLPFTYELSSFFMNVAGLSLLYFGFGLVLLNCLFFVKFDNQPIGVQTIINFVAFIGFYSYSIYLYHIPIKNLWVPICRKVLGAEIRLIEFIGYFLFSILAGVVTSRLIEIPFLKIRNKYFPSRSKAIFNQTQIISPSNIPAEIANVSKKQ